MKTMKLFLAVMILGVTSATASEFMSEKQGEDLLITKRYRYTQPIMFVERGVEFLIFPDGSFDFNTEFGSQYYDDYYYRGRNSRRGSINGTINVPGRHLEFSRPRNGVLVRHDRWGNVRRVGNVFINYDWRGRVKRIGSVFLRYNRRGLITRIGGMRLIYNRRGRIIRTIGHINYYNSGFAPDQSFGNGWISEDDYDDDFYYYRKNGKEQKLKRKHLKKRFKNDFDDNEYDDD